MSPLCVSCAFLRWAGVAAVVTLARLLRVFASTAVSVSYEPCDEPCDEPRRTRICSRILTLWLRVLMRGDDDDEATATTEAKVDSQSAVPAKAQTKTKTKKSKAPEDESEEDTVSPQQVRLGVLHVLKVT